MVSLVFLQIENLNFDIELVPDKMDLRNMKPNEALNKKEIYENDNENNSNVEDDTNLNEDKINKIEFERVRDVQPKISNYDMFERLSMNF